MSESVAAPGTWPARANGVEANNTAHGSASENKVKFIAFQSGCFGGMERSVEAGGTDGAVSCVGAGAIGGSDWFNAMRIAAISCN
jgi:hypothetical protein